MAEEGLKINDIFGLTTPESLEERVTALESLMWEGQPSSSGSPSFGGSVSGSSSLGDRIAILERSLATHSHDDRGSSIISSTMRSANFQSGNNGWEIKDNGDVEFNNGTFRGALSAATIDIGGSDATSFHVDINGNLWAGAGTYNISTNPFAVSNAGVLRAISGAIAGFTIDETEGLYAGLGNTRVQMKPGAGIWAGETAIGDAEFSITNAGVLKAISGTIGGCVLGITSIGSTTFVSGPLGSGWNISNTGTAEFQDATVRGIIRTSVFEKDTISAVNGMVLISKADVLASDMTALDASTLTITGETTFVVNEVIRIKDGADDEWMLVTNATSAPIYTVTRNLAGIYTSNLNPIWKKGTAVVSMGVGTGTKTGFVLLDSSSANSPYIDVYGRNSNTYTDYSLHGRFGWLKGITDADVGLSTTDVWGLYTDNAYIKGIIVATAGGKIGGFEIGTDYIRDVGNVMGLASTVNTDVVIADSYSETHQNSTTDSYAGNWTLRGQSFTNTNRAVLDSCKFYIDKVGTPTGNITTYVYAHSGSYGTTSAPTGSALATSDTVSITTLSESLALQTFSFSGANRVYLEPNTYYCLVIKYEGGDGSNRLEVGVDTSGTHPGNQFVSNDSGATWTQGANLDHPFYVYTIQDDIRFWAGDTFANRASAPFMVYESGGLIATSATITGTINATAGKFGTSTNYWKVGATGLTAISASTDVIINYGKTDFGQDATNGFILGYDYSATVPKLEIGSSATKIFKYDGTDLSLIGGTITGGTVQTSTTGKRVVLTNNILSTYEPSFGNLRLQLDGDVIEFYDPSAVLTSAIMGTNLATDGVDGMSMLFYPSVRLTVSIARDGTTVTVTTSTNHGASSGWYATINGANQGDYNVTAAITVTGVTTFTYETAETPDSPGTGTITARVYPDYYLFSSAGFSMSGGVFSGDLGFPDLTDPRGLYWGSSVTPDATFRWDSGNAFLFGGGDIQITDGGINTLGGAIFLDADNEYTCAAVANRWSDVRTVLLNGADICLENGWKLREYPATKEDIGKPAIWMKENANLGIQILDDEENLMAVIHKDGYIYCKGVKSLSELV